MLRGSMSSRGKGEGDGGEPEMEEDEEQDEGGSPVNCRIELCPACEDILDEMED